MSERAYLREVQYRDDTNLNARAALHERFSVNPVGLQRWIFDLLDLPSRAEVLEVGCGPGHLWVANLDRIPQVGDHLRSSFADIELQHYEDRLEVTDPDTVVAYVLSMSTGRPVDLVAHRRDVDDL